MTEGFEWRLGHVTVGQMGSAYDVENFPRQADMPPGLDWLPPYGESNVVAPAAILGSLGGSQKAYGGLEVTWTWSFLTPGMVSYLFTTMLGGVYAAEATIRIPLNRLTGTGIYVQGMALWPTREMLDRLTRTADGWGDFFIRFIQGVEIT
jgi:hypothetical protein